MPRKKHQGTAGQVQTPDPKTFAVLDKAGVPAAVSLPAAGYSTSTKAAHIRATNQYKSVAKTIQEQREILQKTPGFRLEDSAIMYQNESTDSENPASDRIKARSRLDTILGYDSPKQVDVRSMSLIMELSGVSTEDLGILAGELGATGAETGAE
jgi:hypothetical protein